MDDISQCESLSISWEQSHFSQWKMEKENVKKYEIVQIENFPSKFDMIFMGDESKFKSKFNFLNFYFSAI